MRGSTKTGFIGFGLFCLGYFSAKVGQRIGGWGYFFAGALMMLALVLYLVSYYEYKEENEDITAEEERIRKLDNFLNNINSGDVQDRRYCEDCGTKITSEYCSYCGKRVRK